MTDLITIAPPDPEFGRECLDAPGGFLWWYADMLDAERNGLVLIWSYGLPFLPGYAQAVRNGVPELPRSRPSLNVAVYERGELVCYLLQEFDPSDASWEGGRWRFGGSEISERTRDGVRTLNVELDCPIPGSEERLTGCVVVEGPARRASAGDTVALAHDWSPLIGGGRAVWDLRAGDHQYSGEGRGYHDCNAGHSTLEAAGIYEWTWGRLPFEHAELIYYIAWRDAGATPEAIGVVIDDEGRLEQFPVDVQVDDWRRARAGMRYPGGLELRVEGEPWLHVKPAEVVDDGPFYLRYFVEAERAGESAVGIGEICRPDRIDLDRHRPLVRMRVHRVDRANSMWLPLFSGPRQGRMKRLVSQFVPGGSARR